MRRIGNDRGVALVFVLLVVLIILPLASVFGLRTVQESYSAKKERNLTKTFYVTEGGAYAALEMLDTLINSYLNNTINNINPSVVVNYINNSVVGVSDPDGIGFLILTVRDQGNPVLSKMVTDTETQAVYTMSGISLGGGTVDFIITMEEKEDPYCVTAFPCEKWDFPYRYKVEADGSLAGLGKEILVSGDFTVRVERENFAKYALFTNDQSMPSGSPVWFKDTTSFAGPLHTNGTFNFYGNPGGIFEDIVEQANQQSRFYNNGSPVLDDADSNGAIDVPVFNDAFNRGVNPITLSSPTQEQDIVDQATGGQAFTGNGIFVPNDGASLTGGIFVKGDSAINISINDSDYSVYTIMQGGSIKTITVDHVNNQTTINDGSSTTTYQGLPDGIDDVGTIVYVEGSINSIGGNLQSETQLTVASQGNIVITDHVKYSNYSAPIGSPGDPTYVPPHAKGAKNIFGMVSWGGDVKIGTSAPDDVDVHATVLAKSGIFHVIDHDDWDAGPRGTATVLGGVIQDNYGAFGQFNPSTGISGSGYGRNFVYDERMLEGAAPPYFPTLNTFGAVTNDITDKMVWQEGASN